MNDMDAGAPGHRALAMLFVALGAIAASSQAWAQHYRFARIGGAYAGDGQHRTSAGLAGPAGLAFDAAGNLYIAEYGANRIRRIDGSTGIASTVAGTGTAGFSGDGGPATSAKLNGPYALAIAADGSLLFADALNNRVRRIAPDGIVTTIAGNGRSGDTGDGGDARDATLDWPTGLTLDRDGRVLVADTKSGKVRRIEADGSITTVAGSGLAGDSTGDGGPATLATLKEPGALAVGQDGTIFVADQGDHRIRRIAPNGIIATEVGTGAAGRGPDGRAGTSTAIWAPGALALDFDGGLLFADANCVLRKVEYGRVDTLAGDGSCQDHGDGGDPRTAGFGFIDGLAVRGRELYLADDDFGRVRSIANRTIATHAGIGTDAGDGGPASSGLMSYPVGIAVGPEGDVFVSDRYDNDKVRRVSTAGTLATLAGGIGARGLSTDAQGNVYVARWDDCRVDRISPAGTRVRIAGGTCASSGDGGPAMQAGLKPFDVVVDAAGSVYVSDLSGHRVRRIGNDGIIRTVAGSGVRGFAGDGGSAVAARLDGPRTIAIDASGALYIADNGNKRIRKVTVDGTIRTIAGGGSSRASRGPALDADLGQIGELAVDRDGTVFLTERGKIRTLSPDGMLDTLPTWWSIADGVAIDGDGSLYVSQRFGQLYRGVPARDGTVAHDVDDDGRDELVWRNLQSGQAVLWRGADAAMPQAVSSLASPDWEIAEVADFDGDASTDLFLRNRASGENVFWPSADSHRARAVAPMPDSGWEVAAAADFDDDGAADLLWHHRVTNENQLWYRGDAATVRILRTVQQPGWEIAGAGDFAGDGRADILWHNQGTGANVVWRDGEHADMTVLRTVLQPHWQIAGIADFDGDGRDDLYWYNDASGASTIWKAADFWNQQPVATNPDLNWAPVAFGDFDGDGRDDVLWRERLAGQNLLWKAADSAHVEVLASVPDPAWIVR